MRHAWRVAPLLVVAACLAARPLGAAELPGFADAITNVVEEVEKTVVNIKAIQHGKVQRPLFYDPLFDRFFYGRPNNVVPQRQGEGSGFIYSADGLVLTNEHVVGQADEIMVNTYDGNPYRAEVVGVAPAHDVALLRIRDENFSGRFPDSMVSRLGSSTDLKVGSWVVAIGSPFSLSRSVTVGIVSALGRHLQISPDREYFNLVQTDAAINPGNSGGPLLNLKGEVVAMNTAINPAGQGLGFAIPVNLVNKISQDLLREGRVQRTWLGVELRDVSPALARHLGLRAPTGVYLARVVEGGPADAAGLEAGDVVLRARGQVVDDSRILVEQIQETGAGRAIELEVFKQSGEKVTVRPRVTAYGDLAEGPPPAQTERGSGAAGARIPGLGIRATTLREHPRRPHGIPAEMDGVLVLDVQPGSRGARVGLRVGDVIQKVGHAYTPDREAFEEALAHLDEQANLLLTIFRGDYWLFLAEE